MSEERFQQLESQLAILAKLVTVGWALVIGAFGVGGWVATLEYRHRQHDRSIEIQGNTISEHNRQLRQEEIWRAGTDASRFTSMDWTKSIVPISEAINGHEKRITRVEDSNLATAKALDRIEIKLGTK